MVLADLLSSAALPRALVLGVFGGIGLALTVVYSRRGPMIYPAYAAFLAALALLLARYPDLAYGQRLTVALASFLTAGLIASLIGPQIFHDHLLQAGHVENSPEISHIETAYREANALALGLALLTSLLCAVLVTWLVSRPLRRSGSPG